MLKEKKEEDKSYNKLNIFIFKSKNKKYDYYYNIK